MRKQRVLYSSTAYKLKPHRSTLSHGAVVNFNRVELRYYDEEWCAAVLRVVPVDASMERQVPDE